MSSTLTSADMNVNRSTTRRHAPPGGQSTISFGGGNFAETVNTPPPPPVQQASAPAVKEEPSTPAKESPVIKESPTPVKASPSGRAKIGVAISTGVGSDVVILAVKQAFADAGITEILVNEVAEPVMLPFTVQSLFKSSRVQIVLAVAVIPNDAGSKSLAINNTLLQVGVAAAAPVIPGIVVAESLLEVKAVVPDLAKTWASAVAGFAASLNVTTSSSLVTLPPATPAPPKLTPDVKSPTILLEDLRRSLKEHGANGIIGMGRKFRIIDDDRSGSISFSEFEKLIGEHSLSWTSEQTKAVFDSFDKDKSGTISYDEFLAALRGEMNERRQQLVLQAFEILDADKSGVIEVEDIKKNYDVSKHPDFISGKRSKDEILREFLNGFDGDVNHVKDGKVTPSEFIEYYGSISASIDLDDYFELMIRNAWHISGGEGWCANTSCRRVLVTHTNGKQTVEEIKNDFNIEAGDKAAMLENLIKQGINDVASITVTGTVVEPEPVEAAPVAPAAPINRTVAASCNPGRAVGGATTLVLG